MLQLVKTGKIRKKIQQDFQFKKNSLEENKKIDSPNKQIRHQLSVLFGKKYALFFVSLYGCTLVAFQKVFLGQRYISNVVNYQQLKKYFDNNTYLFKFLLC